MNNNEKKMEAGLKFTTVLACLSFGLFMHWYTLLPAPYLFYLLSIGLGEIASLLFIYYSMKGWSLALIPIVLIGVEGYHQTVSWCFSESNEKLQHQLLYGQWLTIHAVLVVINIWLFRKRYFQAIRQRQRPETI